MMDGVKQEIARGARGCALDQRNVGVGLRFLIQGVRNMTALNDNLLQTTVGQLVIERPARARIFESFGIDYCCGGKQPLGQAIREKGLDEKTVLGVLDAFDQQQSPQADRDWSQATLAELADHIEQTHHAYLKTELPRLEFLVHKVANRHGEHRPQLVELAHVFDAFKAELASHMYKEEAILFPICRQLDGSTPPAQFHCGSVRNPIAVMMREHDDAGDALKRMRELTDDYTAPADACNTYRALFDSLRELEFDMHRHVHKENSILFPRAVEAEASVQASVNA
jgi:regulator of cell morphogenesis and NO signaling